ncbi:uncharacterized protein LOC100181814 isoform X2 [Ciona intestinalis]
MNRFKTKQFLRKFWSHAILLCYLFENALDTAGFCRQMMSKLKRNKSEIAREPAPLRGMPALKQMRSSQRTEALWPKLDPTISHPSLSEFDRTGIRSNGQEMKYIGPPPSVPKQTTNHARASTAPNMNVSKVHKISNGVEKSNGHAMPVEQTNNGSFKNGRKAKTNDKDKLSSKSSESSTDSSKSRTTSNNIGRGLLSVKKERQASRDMHVTSSMRALTPKERESIRFLDDVLKLDDEWQISEGEDDKVFEETSISSTSTLGTNEDESDTSSVGSIIDLVGNLSDVCLSSSSSPRSSEHRSSFSSSFKRNSNNNNNNGDAGLYESIDDTKVEKKHTQPQKKSPVKPIDRNDMIDNEPVYSVVNKPKKTKKQPPPTAQKPTKHQTNSQNENQDLHQGSYEDKPTAKSSREFWNNINTRDSDGQDSPKFRDNKTKVNVLPTSPVKPIKLRHVESPGETRPKNFVVDPHKQRSAPPVAEKQKKPKNNINRSPDSNNSNIDNLGLKLDNSGNLTGRDPASAVIIPGSEPGSHPRDLNHEPMIAVPRQTTLYNNSPTNPSRPFVVTPATRVISWS